MTVPAAVPESTAPPLPFLEPNRTNSVLALLDRALAADLSDQALRLMTAAALRLPTDEFLLIEQYVEASGMTNHAVRRLLPQLVEAGLLQRMRRWYRVDGKDRPRYLHKLAVTR